MNAAKPGAQTTEFWMVMLGFSLTVLTGLRVVDSVPTFGLDLDFARFWLAAVAAYTVAPSAEKWKAGAGEKPGIKTTEFWLVVLGFLLVILTGVTLDAGGVNFALDLDLATWWLGTIMAYIGGRAVQKVKAIKPLPDLGTFDPPVRPAPGDPT